MKKWLRNIRRRLFSKKKENAFRKVYFGIRVRILALLVVVMMSILSIVALIMYQHQKSIIQKEKSSNAEVLVRILTGPAELFLDRDNEMTGEEAELRYAIIEKEVANYKAYNPDISRIVIADEKGRIRYSTSRKEIGANGRNWTYVERGIGLAEDALSVYDPAEDRAFKKRMKGKQWDPFIAVIVPVFIKKGLTTDILSDYRKYYDAYHSASNRAARADIYRRLSIKYKDLLGEDFDPAPPKPAARGRLARGKAPAPVFAVEEIQRINDIDFLFHRIISGAMKLRGRRDNTRQNLFAEGWLFALKRKKLEARAADLLAKENEVNDEIRKNIGLLAEGLESSRRLGTIAVVFNTAKSEKDNERILSTIIIPLLGPVSGIRFIMVLFVIMGCAFFAVLHFMVRNLKKLERWALDVGAGNLGTRIEIRSRDEIGRLGDVFNRMLEEIVQKYHLEKFVSKSTRSMIQRHTNGCGDIDLGSTERKNMAFIFSDVRGFTSFSEKNDPETVINVLNSYLELQSHIVKENRGDIDDYVGDQIMAHFSGERRADQAIDTSVRIIKAIRKANEERKKQGLPIFEVGIGVHGGEVVTGNVGSSFRMDFTCVGDAVNLASRLCSAAAADEILVSQDLFLAAKKKYPHEVIEPISVKGKKEPIPLVRLIV